MFKDLPTPAAVSKIVIPKDQYAHTDPLTGNAPTEWWWHIGTLKSTDGRVFGFEVNAANFTQFSFTQIQITDVAKEINYQKVNSHLGFDPNWAEYDSSKPWFVKLDGAVESPANGAVSMTAIDNDPTHMLVKATFNDEKTNQPCSINLTMKQVGKELLVWGTGCEEINPKGTSPLTKNNYYYSFTNIHTSGTLQIGNETIEVKGTTWMDHEYGFFPRGEAGTTPVIWLLQDMQFDDGLTLSNYTKFGVSPQKNVPMESYATILKDGKSIFVPTKTTPMEPIYKSQKGVDYYLKFKVVVNTPELFATFIVDSLCPDQVFVDPIGADVYEGVGKCSAQYGNTEIIVTGNAWIEQNLGGPKLS